MRKFGKMGIKSEDITIISEASSLEGKLEVQGNVLIQGSFRGGIISRTLEIFKDAKVIGNIEAEDVTIAGYFEGELACSGLLTVAESGTVKGRVAYVALSVERGGLLDAEIFQLESTDTKLIPFDSKKPHTEE
ncbi:MAG: polymer-forming cytoskeletal protein [Deltaproteobacteria bacterium]|jgi:cytoskeletal protein CcmA (bactofilin family)|nr:polymer-forming cytoskeletal protein [Deltaproteobacteria bacterium]MDH3802705.1 polymer-forming cytoskeletal protein [Deltaproteobacteria bacterium]MDH3929562.1 polymer-forming cytoskeletal protein [Deltaproteobacteria bacterium]MDH4012202.1 polymer-forming cytoskeletal protein [Desulfobacterales bacterium]